MIRAGYFHYLGRRLLRHKTSTFIQIVGLSAGLTCFTLIAAWVNDEWGYDRFHQHHDRIVRLTTTKRTETGTTSSARTSAPMAAALARDYAEVAKTVRLDRREEIVEHNGQQTLQPGIVMADPAFFDLFSYQLLRGDRKTALAEPYTIILTETTARKYFGDTDPIGKSLVIYMYDSTGRGANYRVTGIAADPPARGHFTFNILGSFKTVEAGRPGILTREGWAQHRYYTYLLLQKGIDYRQFERKMEGFYTRYLGEKASEWRSEYKFGLQRLTDIHLHSHLEDEIAPNGSMTRVYIFATIGLFILLLAGANFTNLATARSMERAREVGIKKVMGARQGQLVLHYLLESVLITFVALLFSLAISLLAGPYYHQLTGKTLELFRSPALLGFLMLVCVLTGIVAGWYPAWVLAGFRPVVVLKGVFQTGSRGVGLREALILGQFVITLLLVTAIVVIYRQMDFINRKDLGYDKDALILLRLNGNADVVARYEAFRNDLLANPVISGIATSNSFIDSGLDVVQAQVSGRGGEQVPFSTAAIQVDASYPAVYGLRYIAGRGFADKPKPDSVRPVVLNETAVRQMGFKTAEEVLGRAFAMDGNPGEVVGVVRDFHFNSLEHAILPLAIYPRGGYFSRITIKADPSHLPQALKWISQTWKAHFPVALLDYDFVDQQLKRQYLDQERFSALILYFSVLSLLIACPGLYGLISYTARQRTREIGIRKVLGASVAGVAVMLARVYLRQVLLAGAIALPVAWWLMRQWLSEFAYRIDISWWMLALPLLAVLCMAVATVSWQSIRAALTDPVRTLRNE